MDKEKLEIMSSINAIKYKDEPVVQVTLEYMDRRVTSKATVLVNLRVWQAVGHLTWVVMTGKKREGPCNGKKSGQYVRTMYPQNHPLYLHVETYKFYEGQAAIEKGMEVDHMVDPLCNTIQSLRIATKKQNAAARGYCANSIVNKKGVWVHSGNGSYVMEYSLERGIKVTKQSKHMTKGMATLLYNRVAAHYQPDFAYQSEILPDERPNEVQLKMVDRWYDQCVHKLDTKKRARVMVASSSEDEVGSPDKRRKIATEDEQ